MTSVLLCSLQGTVRPSTARASAACLGARAACQQAASLTAAVVSQRALLARSGSVNLCSEPPGQQVVPREDMETGLANLVNSLDDLLLDVPEAIDLLARFIMRAVTDEVLTPAFPRLIPGGEPPVTLSPAPDV